MKVQKARKRFIPALNPYRYVVVPGLPDFTRKKEAKVVVQPEKPPASDIEKSVSAWDLFLRGLF